jgi:hypothetical protein
MSSMKPKKIVSGYYQDDKELIAGIRELQGKGIAISDVRTPFPVHGLDKVLKYKRSRLPRLGFIAGAIGLVVGLGFQIWVFTDAWPLNFGGKPFLSIPSFVPVTFELTVLFAAFALVFGFLIRSGLGPGAPTKIYDEEVTNDRFQILIGVQNETETAESLQALEAAGALGVQLIEI